ncbi:hypothetical protein [Aquimonas voraii]|uniref:Toxin CptA n=1 Tax=Aquimonas voraii TaxID=265719 RepID=A0A1G6SCS6_9GAMM|nr:hypothetical protein [Aquimonas voraii]SDD13947.1 hypothetical protein SAMN04488509_101404 [Aquimonas voraii]
MRSLPLELKPSPVLQAVLVVLALLGLLALWLSALPRAALALPPLLAAISLWRLRRLPRGRLLLHDSGQTEWWPAAVPGLAAPEASPAEGLGLELRGPIAVLTLRIQGRLLRWPLASDTLPGPQLRVLRLWLDRHGERAQAPSSTSTH